MPYLRRPLRCQARGRALLLSALSSSDKPRTSQAFPSIAFARTRLDYLWYDPATVARRAGLAALSVGVPHILDSFPMAI